MARRAIGSQMPPRQTPDPATATDRAVEGLGSNDPAGYAIVVNATPLGMHAGDPLPMDVSRIAPTTLAGEVVMKQEITSFLRAAQERGCVIQAGTDMLFEQIPAYLEFFGFPTTTADKLRAVAKIRH
jgi:shikimate dehydrogenase